MSNKGGFRAIFFLDEVRGSFPMHPDLVIERGCALYVLNYTPGAEEEFQLHRMGAEEYKNIEGLYDALLGVVSAQDPRVIYSVHPNANILLMYKWAIGSRIDMFNARVIEHLSKRQCVDLCEEFYKPMILALEKRENFNCDLVAKWLNFEFKGPDVDRYLNTIKRLCLMIHHS